MFRSREQHRPTAPRCTWGGIWRIHPAGRRRGAGAHQSMMASRSNTWPQEPNAGASIDSSVMGQMASFGRIHSSGSRTLGAGFFATATRRRFIGGSGVPTPDKRPGIVQASRRPSAIDHTDLSARVKPRVGEEAREREKTSSQRRSSSSRKGGNERETGKCRRSGREERCARETRRRGRIDGGGQ